MKEPYRIKRLFWHNLKNFDKPGIHSFGVDEIIAAGVEFHMCDSCGHPKNLFIAANSDGDSSFYYEKDSAPGMGAIIGEHSKIFRHIINNLLNEAGDLTYNMECHKKLYQPPKLNFVTFFALGHKGRFYKTLTYNEVHSREHPYYPLFTYAKQLLSEMRKIEILRLNSKSKSKIVNKNKRTSKNPES